MEKGLTGSGGGGAAQLRLLLSQSLVGRCRWMMLLGRPMFSKDSETAAAAAHYSYIFLSLSLFHTYVRNTANVNSRQLIHNRSSKKERKKERKRNDDDDDDVQSSFRRNIYCSKSRSTNSLFLLAHTHTLSLSPCLPEKRDGRFISPSALVRIWLDTWK